MFQTTVGDRLDVQRVNLGVRFSLPVPQPETEVSGGEEMLVQLLPIALRPDVNFGPYWSSERRNSSRSNSFSSGALRLAK